MYTFVSLNAKLNANLDAESAGQNGLVQVLEFLKTSEEIVE